MMLEAVNCCGCLAPTIQGNTAMVGPAAARGGDATFTSACVAAITAARVEGGGGDGAFSEPLA